MDNCGENIKLVQQAQGVEWRLLIKFEFTAQDTPQQNYLAEIALYCAGDLARAMRARAIMARASIPLKHRYQLFPNTIWTADQLHSLTVITINDKMATQYKHFRDAIPQSAHHLCTWGEMGVIKLQDLSIPKLQIVGWYICLLGIVKTTQGIVMKCGTRTQGNYMLPEMSFGWVRCTFPNQI